MKPNRVRTGRLFGKLRSDSGETLIEALCAILVCVLVIVMFAGMVAAATKINRDVKQSNESVNSDRSAAELQSGSAKPGTVTAGYSDGSLTYDYSVDYYGDELVSYKW